MILRFVNPSSQDERVTVKMAASYFGKIDSATQVDVLERPLEKDTAEADESSISVAVGAFSLASIRVKTAGRGE